MEGSAIGSSGNFSHICLDVMKKNVIKHGKKRGSAG
jgi:hypothetical protein